MTESSGGQYETPGVYVGAGYVGEPVGAAKIPVPVAEEGAEGGSDYFSHTALMHDVRPTTMQRRSAPRIGQVLDGLLNRIDETIEVTKGN